MAFHSLSFDRLTDPALLGQRGAQQFELFGPATSPPPGTLLMTAPDDAMATDHHYRAALPAVSVYALSGHALGSAGLLVQDGSVFWRGDVLPNYFRDVFQPGAAPLSDWVHGMLLPDAETLHFDEPLAVATHPNAIYGHFLLEMLPRLYLLGLLREMGQSFRLALSTQIPEWMERFVALYFAPHEMVRYDSARQLVRAPVFVVPAMLNVDYYLHPAMNLAVADLVARARTTQPAGALVYLSRRREPDRSGSPLENVEAVEAALAELGFAIVHPESLGVRERIEACAAAACLVCESGSEACGALFAPRGCKVVILNPSSRAEGKIAALRGQSLALIEPVGGFRARAMAPSDRVAPFSVDLDLLRRVIAKTLEVSQAAVISASSTPEAATELVAAPLSRLPLGDYLQQMQDNGQLPRSLVYAQPQRRSRAGFLYSEPIDRGLAAFGHLFSDPGYLDYPTAPSICASFPDAVVIGGDGLVMVEGRIVRDTTHSLDAWRAESLVAEADDGGALRLKRPIRLPEPHEGAFFVGFTGGWRSWLNWLVECLPRLYLFNWLRAQVPGLRLLLPNLPPGSMQRRCLDLFGFDPTLVTIVPDDAPFVARTLWCASFIDAWGPPGLVREAALASSALVATDAAEMEGRLPQRLYVRRAGTPLVANFEALQPVLAGYGFVTVVLDDMTFDQQVRLLRQARLIVGESGASLADVMFCASGSRMLEVFGPADVVPTHWSLASLCGVDYGYLICHHASNVEHSGQTPDKVSYVDPEQMAAGLHWLCLNRNEISD